MIKEDLLNAAIIECINLTLIARNCKQTESNVYRRSYATLHRTTPQYEVLYEISDTPFRGQLIAVLVANFALLQTGVEGWTWIIYFELFVEKRKNIRDCKSFVLVYTRGQKYGDKTSILRINSVLVVCVAQFNLPWGVASMGEGHVPHSQLIVGAEHSQRVGDRVTSLNADERSDLARTSAVGLQDIW